MKRLHLKIYGDVQGVSFRYFTKKNAQSLGITGFVRNLPDGTVEVVAEGDRETLEEILDRCEEGPTFAHVQRIDSDWEETTGEFKDFRIERNY